MRVYQEHSDSSSSSDGSSSLSDDMRSVSSFGDDEAFDKRKNKANKKKKADILTAGLVYQPVFAKVV